MLHIYIYIYDISRLRVNVSFFKKKLSHGRDSLRHAILKGNSVTEYDRESTSRNKGTVYSVPRHGASDTKVLGLRMYFT